MGRGVGGKRPRFSGTNWRGSQNPTIFQKRGLKPGNFYLKDEKEGRVRAGTRTALGGGSFFGFPLTFMPDFGVRV